MHRKIVIPSLLLSLLCACIDDTNYLMTTSLTDSPVPRGGAPTGVRYTNNAAAVTTAEVISLRIAGPFELHDRAKLLRAVNEWNVALNGFMRFDILPDGSPPVSGKSWLIVAMRGNGGRSPPGVPIVLAHTYDGGDGSGLMTVYLDRLGQRDLGGVLMHELGHVLGLGHDNGGGLMAGRYHPSSQQCVDKSAARAVAARWRLPVDQLNWCLSG